MLPRERRVFDLPRSDFIDNIHAFVSFSAAFSFPDCAADFLRAFGERLFHVGEPVTDAARINAPEWNATLSTIIRDCPITEL